MTSGCDSCRVELAVGQRHFISLWVSTDFDPAPTVSRRQDVYRSGRFQRVCCDRRSRRHQMGLEATALKGLIILPRPSGFFGLICTAYRLSLHSFSAACKNINTSIHHQAMYLQRPCLSRAFFPQTLQIIFRSRLHTVCNLHCFQRFFTI